MILTLTFLFRTDLVHTHVVPEWSQHSRSHGSRSAILALHTPCQSSEQIFTGQRQRSGYKQLFQPGDVVGKCYPRDDRQQQYITTTTTSTNLSAGDLVTSSDSKQPEATTTNLSGVVTSSETTATSNGGANITSESTLQPTRHPPLLNSTKKILYFTPVRQAHIPELGTSQTFQHHCVIGQFWRVCGTAEWNVKTHSRVRVLFHTLQNRT